MKPIQIIILAALAIVTAVHLYHSWLDDKKKRRYTKPFLLILILVYYLVSADTYSIPLILALVTSWIGDILLMPSGKYWFLAGGIIFMFSHFFFIAVYAVNVDFATVKWGIIIPIALVYYTIVVIFLKILREYAPGGLFVPMIIYLFANATMNVFSLMQLLANPCTATVIAYIGAVLFFVSDCSLYFVRCYKKPEIIFKKHFTVMLTYVLGEFLITEGLLLLA